MSSAWTPENIALLRLLATDNKMSAAQVATHLAMSKGAVMGKLKRLGLSIAKPRYAHAGAAPHAKRMAEKSAPGIAFLDSREGQCRYMVDETPHARRICGDHTVPGKSWCKFHYALVYKPVPVKAGKMAEAA